jgi:hypothetical protein
MAGHTSEKRWRKNQTPTAGRGFSEEVTELTTMMLDVLYKAEQIGLELEEIQDYLGDDSAQSLADQLFYEDWSVRENDPIGNPGILEDCANKDEVSKVEDAMKAVQAAKEIFEFANEKAETSKMKAVKNNKSRISKLRRMA